MSKFLFRPELERAFDALGDLAASRGFVVEIAVCGDTRLLFGMDIDKAIKDIDQAFDFDRERINRIADQVADEQGLPADWLVQCVGMHGAAASPTLPFGDYPRKTSTGVGLRVLSAGREYMRAMTKRTFVFVAADDATVAPSRSIDGFNDVVVAMARADTLKNVVEMQIASGKTALYATFLNYFYSDTSPASRRKRVEQEPRLTGIPKTDAFFGAVGEHLCRRWGLGEPPGWTEQPERFLSAAWFWGPRSFQGFNLAESPSAFRRRLIFTEAEPLRRALTPRDGRWWRYETLRNGLKPVDAEDIHPPSGP